MSATPPAPPPAPAPAPGYVVVRTSPDPAILLIRVMVGWVFLSEGVQKFVLPGSRGAGRFEAIGLPFPEPVAATVGGFEIACGLLVLVGLGVRVAVLPLVTIMLGALVLTKLPILRADGILEAAHAARTDVSMLLGSIFLFVKGAGPLSLDLRAWRDRPDA